MSVRSKIALFGVVVVAIVGLLVFFLGPVLFASVAYPLPSNFQAPIANRAKQYGLSPNTLAALTFVESGFNMTARSGAGAIGPTQFEPATARAVAARLGIKNFSPTDLTKDPDLAEWFAAYYLSTDIKNYGSLHLALVAYNGGGSAAVASERGYGFAGPEGYANKIQRIQSAYDAIYGQWWTAITGSSAPAAPSPAPFTVQPNLSIATSGSVLDIWQGLLTTPASDANQTPITSGTPGDVTNLWKALVPGS